VKFADVYIRLLDGSEAIMVVAPGEQDGEHELDMLFHRVSNAFIYRLSLSFLRVDLPLPYYLRAHANDLHCRVRTLHIKNAAVAIDYALVDFLGACLKPQVYETSPVGSTSFHKRYAMLFTNDTLRRSVSHVVYE
ncbi:hypothetical protein AAVH_20237, partial [Aphelenchoides avenae]